MGFLVPQPKISKLPPLPLPNPSEPQAKSGNRQRKARIAARKARGRRATILTDGRPEMDAARSVRKTLLGQ